jgi:carbamoyltransferase
MILQSKHPDIIGLHGGHHASVALMRNDEVAAVITEERLSRVKKHEGYPFRSLSYIKKQYDIAHLDTIHFDDDSRIFIEDTARDIAALQKRNLYRPPYFLRAILLKFSLTRNLLALRDEWVTRQWFGKRNRILFSREVKRVLPETTVQYGDHHRSHAWAAVPFFPQDGKRRLVITLDGIGHDVAGSINLFENGRLAVLHRFPASASLGLLYGSIVVLTGMKQVEDEFKIMGLAPYAKRSAGELAYEELKKLLWWDEEKMSLCSPINMRYVVAHLIAAEFNIRHRFDSMAYGIQKLCEEIAVAIVRSAIKKYDCHDIAVGGGVFMNVKANQIIAALPDVHSFSITPSCGDESLAIGAAMEAYASLHNGDLSKFKPITDLYLGAVYTDREVERALLPYRDTTKYMVRHYIEGEENSVERAVAELLAKGEVVGRFKGRAEWGARALGNRSILANPSLREMVTFINEMIKKRDFWMPFAASVLYEDRNEYFLNPKDLYAPYMAITFDATEKAKQHLSAAIHPYDFTVRPQMVKQEVNPEYHALIAHFKSLTGISGVLNTSFNLHGEPNVETPQDALSTFERSGLRHLAIGNYLLSKL